MGVRFRYEKPLQKLGASFIGYIGLLVRKGHTTQYRGVDGNLDNHIRFIAVKRIYNIDITKTESISIDEKLVKEIEDRISPETEKLIVNEISNFILFKLAIFQISLNQALLKPPTLIQITYKRIELSRKYAAAHRYFAEANAVRAEVTYSSLIKLLTLITPALLLGGLLKQAILSQAFNFDLGLVFSLGDYISASLSTLIYAMLPLALMLVVGYFSFHEETRLDIKQRQQNRKQERVQRLFIYLPVAFLLFFTYFTQKKNFFILLPIAIWILFGIVLPRVVKRYFKNGLAVFLVSFFAIAFFSNITSSTIGQVFSIREGKDTYTYTFAKSDADIQPENLILVTSGSFYKVFWDKVRLQTVIVKSDLLIAARRLTPAVTTNATKTMRQSPWD